ncbi:MAG: hypothetical protein IPG89_21395 [Bacteroidetes bacterium]|nr:hypothetical protein [Bacteroidota bacterium]
MKNKLMLLAFFYFTSQSCLKAQTTFYQSELQGLDGYYSVGSIITSKKMGEKKMYYNLKENQKEKLTKETFYEATKIIKGEFNTFKFESTGLTDDFFLREIYNGNQLSGFVQVENLNDTIPMDMGGPLGGSNNFVKIIPTFTPKTQKAKFKDWNAAIQKYNIENPSSSSLPYINSEEGFENASASSTLSPQGKYSYNAQNLIDDSPLTAWVEGKDDYGIGESIEITKNYVSGISIYNGHQASQSSFINNSRVKSLTMLINGVEACKLELEDKMDFQKFDTKEFLTLFDAYVTPELEAEQKKIKIKFVITDIYKGLKFKDTCITEISDF